MLAMDVKKEIDDVILDESRIEKEMLNEVCTTDTEDMDMLGGIDTLVKTEKVEDLYLDGVDIGLFGNEDISFSLKTEEYSDENNGLVNVSDEIYDNKGAFLLGEYLDEETGTSFSMDSKSGNSKTKRDKRLFGKKVDKYKLETGSYDEGKSTRPIKIIIKRETHNGFEVESDEGIEENESIVNVRKMHKTKKSKDFFCTLCNKGFTSERRLHQHNSHLHPSGEIQEGRLQCEVCEKRFSSQSRLTMHTVTHTGEKPFACDVCGQKFSHPTNKRRHMLKHTGDKSFPCMFCGKSFPAKHSLKDHLVIHTGDRPHACKVCYMSFAHRFALKRHELLKHPVDVTADSSRPFQCTQCGQGFTQMSSLKVHQRIHTGFKPYKCEMCEESFTRIDALVRHQVKHTGKKPFRCDMCDKSYTSASMLKQHRNVHLDDMPVQSAH